jgi:membrane protein implicated in regulation of membrane protease activity
MRIHESFIHLPRHPVLRALALIAGTVLLIWLVAFGVLVGAAVAALAASTMLVRRWWRRRGGRRAEPDIIEGEFTVVPRTALPSGETSTTRTGW